MIHRKWKFTYKFRKDYNDNEVDSDEDNIIIIMITKLIFEIDLGIYNDSSDNGNDDN